LPNRDNARFTSVGGDRSVFLWDVTTAKTIQRFSGPKGHSARINTVCFGGTDDSVLISGSFDASVRIWDTKSNTQKPIQVLSEAKDSISCVLVNKNGGYEIVTGSVDGRIRYYDLRMGRMDTDVLPGPVTSLAAMKGGEAMLVGTLDGRIRLIDRSGGGCLMTYKGHVNVEFRIRSVFGGKEAWVLSGSELEGEDGQVCVWDTVKGVGQQEGKRRVVSSDGKEKARKNVVSCVAWKNEGRGDQWSCSGTDGVVTVYGLG
jgi:mitogen-activated protein kinase organizer 1